MLLDKARKEVDGLPTETPGNPLLAAARVAMPTVSPNWDVNGGERPKLDHYGDCTLVGL